jgi:hypothetical protein
MERRPLAHLTDAVVTDQRTRRGMLRLAAGAGAGVSSVLSAVDALGKKKHKKRRSARSSRSRRGPISSPVPGQKIMG